jgi:hypothetical protein
LWLSIVACACGGESSGSGTGSGASGGAAGAAGGTGGSGGGAGTGGSGGVDCDPGGVACRSLPPSCPPGEVPSVEHECWGDCVPILDCRPVADCTGCTGFCAAYVAFTTEYRCVMPELYCSATACSCLSPYFCAAPFTLCVEGSVDGPIVSCECPAC